MLVWGLFAFSWHRTAYLDAAIHCLSTAAPGQDVGLEEGRGQRHVSLDRCAAEQRGRCSVLADEQQTLLLDALGSQENPAGQG